MTEILPLRYPTKVGVRKGFKNGRFGAVTIEQKHLVRKSFQAVERAPVVAALVFYRRLFELEPRLRPMFKNDIEVQAQKLMEILGAAVGMLDIPERLTAELEVLGARHVGYGVRDEHYAIVGRALLDMLAEVLGEQFTAEMGAVWTDLFLIISESMQRGARSVASA